MVGGSGGVMVLPLVVMLMVLYPGRSMQEIHLDSKIKLLDCPGIVLPGGDSSDAAAALRNAVKIENLEDPVTPVDAILQRADKKQVCSVFSFLRIS